MEYLGISCDNFCTPLLDTGFLPMEKWLAAYETQAHQPITIAVERGGGQAAVYRAAIRGNRPSADLHYVERCVKFLLWSAGGYRVKICGCDALTEAIARAYDNSFDADFMSTVYTHPFSIVSCRADELPARCERAVTGGGHKTGCRIGFDAGGSDYKVAAVQDGRVVFSQETPWRAKQEPDPTYHLHRIRTALRTAAAHLPRVDAIGVSTAGVVVGNRPVVSSLFSAVPEERMEEARNVFSAAAAAWEAPLTIANDGDVSALSSEQKNVLGVAMGTSEAAGYVNQEGKLTNRLNELAFAPVDLQTDAPKDDWSGDHGVGASYLSQDAVLRLARRKGLSLDRDSTPAQQLRQVQADPAADAVFESVGCYLAHSLALYARFYEMECVYLQGRVLSGRGGEVILRVCRQVLAADYPARQLAVLLPDEGARRTGQAVTAAGL